jgi:preprotein translocase subunit SecB
MKPSPIQLLQLSYKRVCVEIDPNHTLTDTPNPMANPFDFSGVSLTTETGLGELDLANERGQLYLVSLRLVVNNEASADEPERRFSPYLIDVEAAGVILLHKGAEKLGPPHDLVMVNGAAMLWSALREQVSTLTSRMVAGPAMLPTVHFQDLKQGAVEPPAPPAPPTPAATKAKRAKSAPSAAKA